MFLVQGCSSLRLTAVIPARSGPIKLLQLPGGRVCLTLPDLAHALGLGPNRRHELYRGLHSGDYFKTRLPSPTRLQNTVCIYLASVVKILQLRAQSRVRHIRRNVDLVVAALEPYFKQHLGYSPLIGSGFFQLALLMNVVVQVTDWN